jgi:transposase
VSELVKLSEKELYTAEIIQKCVARELTNAQAAADLGLGIRQVQRLKRNFKRHGVKALASKKRGRPSNHQLPGATKTRTCELLQRRYPDFGPTLAHEKLSEVHHLVLSRETVRQWMMAEGLWHPQRVKRIAIHPLRERRAQRGELVQIDGSPYAWFEARAAPCTLLVFIDDATGELLELFFCAAETTHSYFQATERYLRAHGRPLLFYSDKFGVFRINHPHDLKGDGETQFARAMRELAIELKCANTPQAKGRVERVHQTLQDRLVKELRLREISDIATANAYLPEFGQAYNRRFAVAAREPADAHRPLRVRDDLNRILALRELRTLSKNLTLSYNRVVYQIQTRRAAYALRHAKVEVRERWDGTVQILYQDKPLDYAVYREPPRQAELFSRKALDAELNERAHAKKKRKPNVPPANHPWRRFRINNRTLQSETP